MCMHYPLPLGPWKWLLLVGCGLELPLTRLLVKPSLPITMQQDFRGNIYWIDCNFLTLEIAMSCKVIFYKPPYVWLLHIGRTVMKCLSMGIGNTEDMNPHITDQSISICMSFLPHVNTLS